MCYLIHHFDSLTKFNTLLYRNITHLKTQLFPVLEKKYYPPATITDLSVNGISHGDYQVNLKWTATGSQLYEGTGRSQYYYVYFICVNSDRHLYQL